MSLPLMLMATLAISMTAVVLLSLSDSKIYSIVVNDTDYSLDIPDDWAYEKFITPAVSSTPNEFGVILLNTDKPLNEKMKNEGAYFRFEQDSPYGIKNAPLDLYVKYKLDKQDALNVTDKQNTTLGGEPAAKIYGNGIKDYSGTKLAEYLLMHDDKPYYLSYLANVKDFEKYLPGFEHIAKSLKFTK